MNIGEKERVGKMDVQRWIFKSGVVILHPSTANAESFVSLLFGHSHVILPKELAKTLPKSRLLTESEWRGIGVQQSRGWHHYAIHRYVLAWNSHKRITLLY